MTYIDEINCASNSTQQSMRLNSYLCLCKIYLNKWNRSAVVPLTHRAALTVHCHESWRLHWKLIHAHSTMQVNGAR